MDFETLLNIQIFTLIQKYYSNLNDVISSSSTVSTQMKPKNSTLNHIMLNDCIWIRNHKIHLKKKGENQQEQWLYAVAITQNKRE